MGYRPEKKIYNLVFADREGLEVKTRSATLGEVEKVSAMSMNIHEKDEAKRLEVFAFFSKKLISWNVEHPELDDEEAETCTECGLLVGAPLPTTVQSMKCLELDMIVDIIKGWVFAVGRVSIPKELSSKNGGSNIPEEVMKQLDALQSPGTLPTPNFS